MTIHIHYHLIFINYFVLILSYNMTAQTSCIAAPSKVQSGASQCAWSKDDSLCSIANPPSDPVFTILVALLTMIMSIPVLMVLQYFLEEFASKTPGKRAYPHVNAVLHAKENHEKPIEKSLQSIESTVIHRTASQSDFARIIKMSVSAGSSNKKAATKGEVAHFAYAGELMVLCGVVWCSVGCVVMCCDVM
jgi:hypothetical protein